MVLVKSLRGFARQFKRIFEIVRPVFGFLGITWVGLSPHSPADAIREVRLTWAPRGRFRVLAVTESLCALLPRSNAPAVFTRRSDCAREHALEVP